MLTAKGGLISDGEGYITSEWAWPKATRSVTLQLNKCLSLVFKDRHNISVKFANDGVTRVFECGLKFKRDPEDDYLSRSTRLAGDPVGKVRPDVSMAPSLRERAAQFNEEMKFKRNKFLPYLFYEKLTFWMSKRNEP